MPEDKPASQWLSDIDGKDQQGRTVADKSDDNGQVDDVLEFTDAEHISQQAGKESTAADGDHGNHEDDEDQDIDDADQLHLGGEWVFLETKPVLAIRAGLWHDPDHRPRANQNADPEE